MLSTSSETCTLEVPNKWTVRSVGTETSAVPLMDSNEDESISAHKSLPTICCHILNYSKLVKVGNVEGKHAQGKGTDEVIKVRRRHSQNWKQLFIALLTEGNVGK